ncbi:MAG: hypothetical protein QXH55_03160 [Candidatus Korarchaeota archaeon]|nr:hypothetical protein [Thermoproteota archaeon]MCR8463140.1 hypothetical protein [Thermoproteota archaeon]MCR8471015.1 hypothetical protein [Thermoproteota archaeon]MCR8471831.1 hypothetical protein [Thermoproteota archaeon]MCR8472807.1 hypothetical protein [Thermoproteota archaeon]
MDSSQQASILRRINRLRRFFLTLAELKAGSFGKAIAAVLLSRGSLSESSSTIYTGLPVLNARAVVSALTNGGLLYIVGEKPLQMRDRRQYVEVIFGTEPVQIDRTVSGLISSIIALLHSLAEVCEIESILHYCKQDKILFLEREVETYGYCCPICGNPLNPITVNPLALDRYLNEIRSAFIKRSF